MITLPEQLAIAVRHAIGREKAGLHEPCFDQTEKDLVLDCIESNFVSSVGQYVIDFEQSLAAYLQAKRVVAVVNGTSALQIALLLSGVITGNEVIVPSLSFVATANAVRYLNATPHFIDSNYESLGLDPVALKNRLKQIAVPSQQGVRNKFTNALIKAIVPMHTFGHPCMMDEIMEIANHYEITVVEDAAESLGSKYKGSHTATIGKIGAISFNGNKIITTGGGGALIFNDDTLADEAKHLTTTAKVPHAWDFYHDRVAYNFRMPNINAALGCAQLRKLDEFVTRKRFLYERYAESLQYVNGISLFKEPFGCESNYWLQTILLDRADLDLRNSVLNHLNAQGIVARPLWRLLHELPMYKDCPRSQTPVAEDLSRRCVNIPSSPQLAEDTIAF